MVKSDYKEALCIGNEYLRQQLRDGWSGPLSYFQTTVKLSTPLILPSESATRRKQTTFFFQIRLGTQLTTVDEMATIVLQAWHALASQDTKSSAVAWQHLLPLLEIYSKHPMPIQFFVQIWIPFWQSSVTSLVASNMGSSLALAWSLQVSVLLVEQSLRIEGTPVLLQELRDELVESFFIQQLPKLSSDVLARQMAMAVLTPRKESWEPLIHQINDFIQESAHQASLHTIRSILEDSSTTRDLVDDLRGISTELRQKLLRHESLQNLPAKQASLPSSDLVSCGDAGPVNQRQALVPKFLRDRWGGGYVLPPSLQHLFDRLRQHATKYISSLQPPIKKSSSHAQAVVQWRKTQLAISIVSLLLAWRHRGLLRRWSKTVSLALLAPVTELVEVLAPRTSENDTSRS